MNEGGVLACHALGKVFDSGPATIEVLREVKRLDPAPKVIMLTNYAHAQYRDKCEEAGADFFLDKSTEFDKLPQALEQVRQGLRADAGAGGQSQSHDALVDSTLVGRTS